MADIEFDFKIKPWKHQLEAFQRFKDDNSIGLFFEVGCIAPHMEVCVNSRGKSSRMSIERFFRVYHGVEGHVKNQGPFYIRGLQNDNRIGLNKVLDVVRSGEKEVIRVRVEKHRYVECTADHKIFTRNGWKRAGDLQSTDMVAIDLQTKWQKKKNKKERAAPHYLQKTVGPYYRYGYTAKVYKGTRKKEAIHRLIFSAHSMGISLEEYLRRTKDKKLSDTLLMLSPKEWHIHHKDHNSKNNSIENLECLSAKEHLKIHGNSDYFGHGKIAWRSVKSIEYVGRCLTYDICCETPNNSFVANSIVVHNSGKTSTAVNIVRYKYKYIFKDVVPTLILCPPIVVKNWKNELKMHSNLEDKDICELFGSQVKRVATFKKSKAKVFITNYEALLMKDLYEEFKQKNFPVLILDELHKLKSIQAKRTKLAIDLADRSLVRIGLTGTPVLNTPMDLFSQFRALDKGETFGKNFFAFRAKYFYDKNQYMPTASHFPDWRPKPGILDEFNKLVSKKSMHVKKADCLDLPPLVKKKIYFDMSPEQTRAYKEMSKDLITFFGQQAVSAQIALTKFLRLQQITTGFVTDDDGNIIKLPNPRSKVLQELLEDLTPNHKVIVWAVFKENYEEIRKVCNLLGVKFVEVHGEVGEKARYENVDSFNNDESVRVLIGHPGSGGIGINLVASDVSIFYSRNFSLEQDIQAEARNYRGGSEKHAKVTRIDLVCSDSIDEDVCEAIDKKVSIGEAILRKWDIG